MRHTDEQIQAKNRERFERVALRLAHNMQESSAECYSALPQHVKEHFESQQYKDLALQLARFEYKKGHSIRGIALRYGLPRMSVWRAVK